MQCSQWGPKFGTWSQLGPSSQTRSQKSPNFAPKSQILPLQQDAKLSTISWFDSSTYCWNLYFSKAHLWVTLQEWSSKVMQYWHQSTPQFKVLVLRASPCLLCSEVFHCGEGLSLSKKIFFSVFAINICIIARRYCRTVDISPCTCAFLSCKYHAMKLEFVFIIAVQLRGIDLCKKAIEFFQFFFNFCNVNNKALYFDSPLKNSELPDRTPIRRSNF